MWFSFWQNFLNFTPIYFEAFFSAHWSSSVNFSYWYFWIQDSDDANAGKKPDRRVVKLRKEKGQKKKKHLSQKDHMSRWIGDPKIGNGHRKSEWLTHFTALGHWEKKIPIFCNLFFFGNGIFYPSLFRCPVPLYCPFSFNHICKIHFILFKLTIVY